jgi:tetratricopeptide (TPR) repeat protein
MLEEADRSLFACLSVFVGGAGLEAVEELCGAEVAGDVLDTLGSLVEKSLVRQSEGIDGEPRFAMLETIREFALEQRSARGGGEELRRRHAELFATLVEALSARVMASDKGTTLDLIEQDHDNLRAAMSWAIETGAADLAMRLGSALWRFWQMRGYLQEGLERIEQALALPHSHDHPERRADALSAAAGVAYWLGASDHARELYELEIEARRGLGDRRGLAEALYGISFTWSIRGLLEERIQNQAVAYINEARDLFREIGDEPGVGRCEWALANVAWGNGRLAEAMHHGKQALAVFESIDDRFMVGWTSYTLGLGELSWHAADRAASEHLENARRWLREALEIFAEAQDVSGYTLVLDAVALVALRDGDRDRAARLSAAVASLERTSGTGLNEWNRDVLGFQPDELKADPALADAWRAGEAMTANEAVAYARGS